MPMFLTWTCKENTNFAPHSICLSKVNDAAMISSSSSKHLLLLIDANTLLSFFGKKPCHSQWGPLLFYRLYCILVVAVTQASVIIIRRAINQRRGSRKDCPTSHLLLPPSTGNNWQLLVRIYISHLLIPSAMTVVDLAWNEDAALGYPIPCLTTWWHTRLRRFCCKDHNATSKNKNTTFSSLL
jgi:hypothetical protein